MSIVSSRQSTATSIRSRRLMNVGIVLVGLMTLHCTQYFDYATRLAEQDAVDAVRAQIVEFAESEQLELRVTGNKWGEGLIVHHPARASAQPFVWLYLGGNRVYAVGDEELSLTPRVPLIKGEPEVLRTAGLLGVSREAILQHVLVAPAVSAR